MAKQLYCVRIEAEVYVVAESEAEAEEEATSYDVLNGTDDWDTFAQVATAARLPSSWRGCIPWGDADDKTVEQWFAIIRLREIAAEAEANAKAEFDSHPKLLEV